MKICLFLLLMIIKETVKETTHIVMNEDKVTMLLEKYEKLRRKPVLVESNSINPTKRTFNDTNAESYKTLPTLKQLKNKDLHHSSKATVNKNILSKYENDESVNGTDNKLQTLGDTIFKNMKQFDDTQYEKSSDWYVNKELERLARQVNK